MTLVQSAINNNAGAFSVACNWPATTTAGNLLIIAVQLQGHFVSLTPPSGWTQAAFQNNASNLAVAIFYIENAGSRSGTETFTFSPSTSAIIVLAEYSGVVTASSLDGSGVGALGTGTAAATPSLTTTNATDLLISAIGYSNLSLSFTAQGSPTNSFVIEKEGQANSFNDLALLDKSVSATGSYSTGTSQNQTIPWAAVLVAFKTTGGGGGGGGGSRVRALNHLLPGPVARRAS